MGTRGGKYAARPFCKTQTVGMVRKVGEVLRQGGLVVTAYSADHAPPHVHVFRRGEDEIVLLLDHP